MIMEALDLGISVIGTGYVGLVTGACLADFGNEVICVDKDREKIARLGLEIVPTHPDGAGGLGFLEQLEILFPDTAVGTQPVLGDVFPFGTRCNAVVRPAFLLVVDQATHDAFVLAHICSRSAFPGVPTFNCGVVVKILIETL